MQVFIDQDSGFCSGVVRAIRMAEENSPLYCLGEIVHNQAEIERLTKKGLKTITYDEFRKLENASVLLRAHGEPPETYQIAKKNNIRIIDASCKIVVRLQEQVKKASEEILAENGQVVIYGNEFHPEVIGLKGQSKAKVLVIENEQQIEKIDFSRPVRLFSQTTKSRLEYQKIKQQVEQKAKDVFPSEKLKVKTYDSICKQVSNREDHLKEFAQKHDVIIFVGGKNSSNAKLLYGICKAINSRTYFVSQANELKTEWLKGAKTIGVSGATSTPQWLIDGIAAEIKKY